MSEAAAAEPARPHEPAGPSAHVGAPAPPLHSLRAGALGTLAALPMTLALGLVAFAAMGPLAGGLGIPASFATMVLASVVLALASRCTGAMASPSPATALALAALVLPLAQDLQFAAMLATKPLEAARWVGVAAACAVLGMGLLQLALAACGLARLAHYVPQPVLAGFVNGIALLIVLAQMPLLLGAGPGAPAALWWAALQQGGSGPLWLGLGTAVCIALVMRLLPRWPALLMGLVAGVAAALALGALWPALSFGNPVGAANTALPTSPAWLLPGDPAVAAFVARHAPDVALTAALLAMIGSLESMLTIVSSEQGSGRRIAAGRELAALGLANVAGGLLGALPAVMVGAGTAAFGPAGGRGPLAALAVAATAAAVLVFAGPALAWVPQAVLAGVLLGVAWLIAERGSGRLARRWWHAARRGPQAAGDETLAGLAVMGVVCALTALLGVAAGVAAGAALSLVVFVRRSERTLVHTQTSGTARPSRRIYPGAIEAHLLGLRSRVAVLELEGALFYGSGAALPERIEALAPPVRFVVFDLRRVSTVDESGVMLLHEVAQRLATRGQELLLAGVVQGGAVARSLDAFAPWPADRAPRTFTDADRAMEAAEAALLAEAAHEDPALSALLATGAELPLEACTLVRGLSARELRIVAAAMVRRELRAGEVVFRQGDSAEALYVVTRGSVSAVAVLRGPLQRVQRFASLGPGTMFGEMALLDQAGRSADAVADDDACVQVLPLEALEQLLLEHPELAAKLYRNIAAHLGERLRVASVAWQAAAA